MGKVAFTGYRPDKLPFREDERDGNYKRFRNTLKRVIGRLCELGYNQFISGVARGFDTWVAEDVLEIKEQYSEATLECAIPFPAQAEKWRFKDRLRREEILKRADSTTVTSPEYSNSCFFVRNRYMVDKADVIVCCYDGKAGGTAYTVDYARQMRKIIIQINPTDMVVSIVGGSL